MFVGQKDVHPVELFDHLSHQMIIMELLTKLHLIKDKKENKILREMETILKIHLFEPFCLLAHEVQHLAHLIPVLPHLHLLGVKAQGHSIRHFRKLVGSHLLSSM